MARGSRRKRKPAPTAKPAVTLEANDVKDLKRGMKVLLQLYAERKKVNKKLAQLDDRIRAQRRFNADILRAGESRDAQQIGELPGAPS